MTNEQNPERSVARDDAQRDGAGKHIIFKSRIVSPKVEKPDRDRHTECGILMPSFHYAFMDYNDHLESLWPDGIECSAELLAKYGDGAEVEEGKDYVIKKDTNGIPVEGESGEPVAYYHTLLAVPVQSDEGELWSNVIETVLSDTSWHNEGLAEKLQSQYKLTKR